MVEEVSHRFLPGIAPLGQSRVQSLLREQRRSPLVLWQDVNCGASCPLLSAKWIPHALPWRMIMGPARRVWGHFCLAGAERYGVHGLLTPGD
ncbi:rCG53648 [Rattus norvegicus]|uniref:RCG53648 n=1 Tax=Rattus norvegicus TaxID=10116 RepID=A6J8A9_RAT|nr:rCG53648 [Rattus norvegicus]